MAFLSGHIVVWINAFIPRDVPGFTKLITKGINSGKTAVPLPRIAKLRVYNFMKPDGTGYLTDQRDFSSSMTASARMQSLARLSLYPPRLVGSMHETSGTREVNIDSGNTQGEGIADMSGCRARGVFDPTGLDILRGSKEELLEPMTKILDNLTRAPQTAEVMERYNADLASQTLYRHSMIDKWKPEYGESYAMLLEVHGEAGDPLVGGAANIDYTVNFLFNIDVAKSRLLVGVFGRIDSFPAFEAYAHFNGLTKTLFRVPPPSGNTVVDLVGYESMPVAAAVSFP